MAKFFLLLFTILLAIPSAYARPIIIDHDASIDDVLAIAYLLRQKNIEIKALTIAATGEAHCQAALRNMQSLLQLEQAKGIPVACGKEQPLVGSHTFPNWIRHNADKRLSLNTTATKLPKQQTASGVLVNTLASSKQPIDIIALGPLTNIAEVFTKRRDLKAKVHRLYIMGGAIHVAGNVAEIAPKTKNDTAEWNFYIDPTATDIVFRSGVPITLVPLDVTNHFPIDEKFYQRLEKQPSKSILAKRIKSLLLQNKHVTLEQGGWYFWDILTAFVAINEPLASFDIKKLTVITQPETTSGRIQVNNKSGRSIRVCTHVNQEKFNQFALGSVLR